jgi:DNA invertase Pin-like site-specific DNA recombinase
MTAFGYARVSSEGQCLDAQQEALTTAGATKIFAEKLSGASATNRKQLARVLANLQPGDVLLVTRLDRLARSTRDLLNVLDSVGKAGAAFRSLAETWADTTTAHGRLMLTILGGLAEFERELIKMRTSEGRIRAKARGVHMGRHSALNQDQQREVLARIEAGDTLMDIARTFAVSHTTIARLRAKVSLKPH